MRSAHLRPPAGTLLLLYSPPYDFLWASHSVLQPHQPRHQHSRCSSGVQGSSKGPHTALTPPPGRHLLHRLFPLQPISAASIPAGLPSSHMTRTEQVYKLINSPCIDSVYLASGSIPGTDLGT